MKGRGYRGFKISKTNFMTKQYTNSTALLYILWEFKENAEIILTVGGENIRKCWYEKLSYSFYNS